MQCRRVLSLRECWVLKLIEQSIVSSEQDGRMRWTRATGWWVYVDDIEPMTYEILYCSIPNVYKEDKVER